MLNKLWQKISLSILTILFCTSAVWSRAAIFSEYSLEQAKQQAQKEGKLLLIDFTASWCPPCKKMEATTWSDGAVQAWMKESVIAIQIDVDKDSKTTHAFNVKAMPTLLLFTPQSGEKEFGRQDGFLSANELIQWLEGAKSGKSAVELEKEAGSAAAVWPHLNKAREMQTAGKDAQAFEEYLWLWTNIKKDDPNIGDLKVSLLPIEMKKLCATYPAAKAKWTELRDAAEKENKRQDWFLLNGVLDDNERSLAWFDRAKTDPSQRDEIIAQTKSLEPILFSKSRWADVANFLYPDPLAKINEYYKRAQGMKRPRPDTEFATDFDPFPSMVLLLYGAYIGANREAEAKTIADECFRLDDTPGMRDALSKMASGMRQARTAQGSSVTSNTTLSKSAQSKPAK